MNKVAQLFAAKTAATFDPTQRDTWAGTNREQGISGPYGPQRKHSLLGGVSSFTEGMIGAGAGAAMNLSTGVARGVAKLHDRVAGHGAHWDENVAGFQVPFHNATLRGTHQMLHPLASSALSDYMQGSSNHGPSIADQNAAAANNKDAPSWERWMGSIGQYGPAAHSGASALIPYAAVGSTGSPMSVGKAITMAQGTATGNAIENWMRQYAYTHQLPGRGLLGSTGTEGPKGHQRALPQAGTLPDAELDAQFRDTMPAGARPQYAADATAYASAMRQAKPSMTIPGANLSAQDQLTRQLRTGQTAPGVWGPRQTPINYARGGDDLAPAVAASFGQGTGQRPLWNVMERHFLPYIAPPEWKPFIEAAGTDPAQWPQEYQQAAQDWRYAARQNIAAAEKTMATDPKSTTTVIPDSYTERFLPEEQRPAWEAYKQDSKQMTPDLKMVLRGMYKHYNIARLNNWDKLLEQHATPAPTVIASFDRWLSKAAGLEGQAASPAADPDVLDRATSAWSGIQKAVAPKPPEPVGPPPQAPATPKQTTSPAAADPDVLDRATSAWSGIQKAVAPLPAHPGAPTATHDFADIIAPDAEPNVAANAGQTTPGTGATPSAAPQTAATAQPANTATPGAANQTPAAGPQQGAEAQGSVQQTIPPAKPTHTPEEIAAITQRCQADPAFRNSPEAKAALEGATHPVIQQAAEQAIAQGHAADKHDFAAKTTAAVTQGTLTAAQSNTAVKNLANETGSDTQDPSFWQRAVQHIGGLIDGIKNGDVSSMWKMAGLVLGIGGVAVGLGQLLSGEGGAGSIAMLVGGALGIAGGSGLMDNLFGAKPPAAGADTQPNAPGAVVSSAGATAATQQFHQMRDQGLEGPAGVPGKAPGAAPAASGPGIGPTTPPTAQAQPAQAPGPAIAHPHQSVDRIIQICSGADPAARGKVPNAQLQLSALHEIQAMPPAEQELLLKATLQQHPQFGKALQHAATLPNNAGGAWALGMATGIKDPQLAQWLIGQAKKFAPTVAAQKV